MKFRYKGDQFKMSINLWFLFLFGWAIDGFVFRSLHYEFGFNSFKDYWLEIGKRGALIDKLTKSSSKTKPKAYSSLEVAQKLARSDLGDLPGVVMYYISPIEYYKLAERFPGSGIPMNSFTEDYLVLPTRDREAAVALVRAIRPSLAIVAAFCDGNFITNNE